MTGKRMSRKSMKRKGKKSCGGKRTRRKGRKKRGGRLFDNMPGKQVKKGIKIRIIGGKDKDKTEESARTENSAGNEPAANPTGDRENE